MFLLAWAPYFLGASFRFTDPELYARFVTFFATAFGLHAVRFFFVHGRSPGGRALKIDAELERAWHRSRERSRARRELYAGHDEFGGQALAEISGSRLRLTGEGELEEISDGAAAPSARQGSAT